MLKLEGVNELNIKKYVEEEDEELDIFINLKHIDFSWESLKHPRNDVVFASVIGKGGNLQLFTHGEINIIDTETDTLYTNNSNFSKELTDKIESGDIYHDDNFLIGNNNWFQAIFSKRKEDDFSDDISVELTFEATPESVEELIDDLISCYNFLVNTN